MEQKIRIKSNFIKVVKHIFWVCEKKKVTEMRGDYYKLDYS